MQHAQGLSNEGSGKRSQLVMKQLGWLDDNNKVTGELSTIILNNSASTDLMQNSTIKVFKTHKSPVFPSPRIRGEGARRADEGILNSCLTLLVTQWLECFE
ncbi:MAG: hypothetical protein M1486_03080 [Gammaproteobacteria bacterium]|nr:hypothetical protein [Gammaproteobacteria bacterium]